MIIANVGDDSVDYDEGWRGKVPVRLRHAGHCPAPTSRTRAAEQDGGNNPDGSQPFAIPTIYNATYIGRAQKTTYTDNVDEHGDRSSATTPVAATTTASSATSAARPTSSRAATPPAARDGPNTSGERANTAYAFDQCLLGPDSTYQLELRTTPGGASATATCSAAPDASAVGGSSKLHYDNDGFGATAPTTTTPAPTRCRSGS